MRELIMRDRTMQKLNLGALVVALLLVTNTVFAQNWPTRPVRWIVPVPPGGPADISARLFAPRLAERLGQPVVIENRAGAAMNIGMEATARATPDGHTIGFVIPSMVTNRALYKLNFDPLVDLAPVARLTETHFLLLGGPKLTARTVPDLIALAKTQPGKLTFGGGGALPQLSMEILRSMAGIDLVMVPYKGNAPAMNALVAGEIDLLVDTLYTALAQVKSGKVRAIASTHRERRAPLTDTPTVAETLPGYEFIGWQGIVAPAGTPRAIVERLAREVEAVLQHPEVRQRTEDLMLDLAFAGPDAFATVIRRDHDRYAAAIAAAGIKAE